MVRHIVMWTLKEEDRTGVAREYAVMIKNGLEDLRHFIPGIVKLEVNIDPLPASDADIILDSVFKDREALEEYQNHPRHKEISRFVGKVRKDRMCMDYEIDIFD